MHPIRHKPDAISTLTAAIQAMAPEPRDAAPVPLLIKAIAASATPAVVQIDPKLTSSATTITSKGRSPGLVVWSTVL